MVSMADRDLSSLRLLAVAALFGLALPGAAAAQTLADTLRGSLRDAVRAGDLAGALHSFSIFGGVPGISAASYDIGGLDLDSYKVPLAHSFAPFASGWLEGVSPYAELTLSYIHARQNVSLNPASALTTGARVTFDATTALAGIGLDVPVLEPIGGRTVLRPIFLAGYTRVTGDARFSGENAALLTTALQGLLTNVSSDSLMLGGAIALVHDRELGGDITMQASLRYNQIADIGLNASDKALDTTNGFGVGTAALEFKGPTGIEIAGHGLRWIAFANGNWLFGPHRDALGFTSFVELGGGVEIATGTALPLVQGISLRGSGIFGDGITGWSVGLSVSF
jgi:hypothetical protein